MRCLSLPWATTFTTPFLSFNISQTGENRGTLSTPLFLCQGLQPQGCRRISLLFPTVCSFFFIVCPLPELTSGCRDFISKVSTVAACCAVEKLKQTDLNGLLRKQWLSSRIIYLPSRFDPGQRKLMVSLYHFCLYTSGKTWPLLNLLLPEGKQLWKTSYCTSNNNKVQRKHFNY